MELATWKFIRQHQIAKFARQRPEIVQRIDDRSLATKRSGVLATLCAHGLRLNAFGFREPFHRVAENIATCGHFVQHVANLVTEGLPVRYLVNVAMASACLSRASR